MPDNQDKKDMGHVSQFEGKPAGLTVTLPQSKEFIDLSERILRYKLEAYIQRARQHAAWDQNLVSYLGAKAVLEGSASGEGLVDGFASGLKTGVEAGGLYAYTANRIKNVILNKTAMLTQSEPTVHIVPRASGSRSDSYVLKPEAGQKVFLEMQESVKTGGTLPPHIQYILEKLGDTNKEALQGDISITLEQYSALMEVISETTGALFFKPEDFICVNDVIESDVLGTTYSAIWERSSGSEMFKRLVLATMVFGWNSYPTVLEL